MADTPLIIPNYTMVSEIVARYRQEGKKIVLTQGSFDMIHIGHGRYLERAAKHGDVLIVGVDSDEKIRERKGPDRPVVPQEERMEMLTHLKSVNHVVLKEVTKEKWELIKLIHPDVLIATLSTYSADQLEALKEFCGEVVVLEAQATTSTSAKLRLLQIAFAYNFSSILAQRIEKTIGEVLSEFKS
ncbi:adenylyltransferase/cytidyltransferase family protein [Candidatus Woesebacteria bacterium]|nr:adenylyltransferase/cytidyltransferase family protein [Candidatus Woesebacteria bacterium]